MSRLSRQRYAIGDLQRFERVLQGVVLPAEHSLPFDKCGVRRTHAILELRDRLDPPSRSSDM